MVLWINWNASHAKWACACTHMHGRKQGLQCSKKESDESGRLYDVGSFLFRLWCYVTLASRTPVRLLWRLVNLLSNRRDIIGPPNLDLALLCLSNSKWTNPFFFFFLNIHLSELTGWKPAFTVARQSQLLWSQRAQPLKCFGKSLQQTLPAWEERRSLLSRLAENNVDRSFASVRFQNWNRSCWAGWELKTIIFSCIDVWTSGDAV